MNYHTMSTSMALSQPWSVLDNRENKAQQRYHLRLKYREKDERTCSGESLNQKKDKYGRHVSEDSLREDINYLNILLEEKKRNLQFMHLKCLDKADELKNVQDAVHNMRNRYTGYDVASDTTRKLLEATNQDLKVQIKNKNDEITTLRDELKRSKKRYADLDADTRMQSIIDKASLSGLKIQLQQQNNKIKWQQEQIKKHQDENKNSKIRYEDQITRLENTIKTEQEKSEKTQRISDISHEMCIDSLKSKEQKIDELKLELKHQKEIFDRAKETTTAKYAAENAPIQIKWTPFMEHASPTDPYHFDAKTKLNKNEQELTDMKQQLQHEKSEIKRMKNEFENNSKRLEDHIRKLTEEKVPLERPVGKTNFYPDYLLAKKLGEATLQLRSNERELLEIQKQLQNSKQESDKAKLMYVEQISKLEQEKQTLKKAEQRSLNLDNANVKQLEDLRSNLQEKERALSDLKAQMKNAQRELDETKNRFLEQISILEKEKQTLKKTLEYKSLYSDDANVKQLENVKSTLQDKEKALSDLKAQLKLAQYELDETKTRFSEQIKNLEQEKQTLNKTFEQRLLLRDNGNIKQLDDVKSNLRDKERTISDLKAQLKNIQHELDDTKNRYLNQISKLENENQSLRQTFEQRLLNSEDVKHSIFEKENELRELATQLQNIQNELEKTKTRHVNQITQLENEKRALSHTFEQRPICLDHVNVKQLDEIKSRLSEKERELEDLKKQLQSTRDELDDTKTRLSKVMGDKLTDGNPAITDLSDKNRPTKILEKYLELYDNQWTDAFEALRKMYHEGEQKIVETLLEILKVTAKYCEQKAIEQMDSILKSINMSTSAEMMPQNIKKNLKDCRKATAEISAKSLYEEYVNQLRQSSLPSAKKSLDVQSYLKECFEICWLMAVQDPPVVMKTQVQQNDIFNTDTYRAYTRSGKAIDFVVWPPLLLHSGGPVLCKGIAQGVGDTK